MFSNTTNRQLAAAVIATLLLTLIALDRAEALEIEEQQDLTDRSSQSEQALPHGQGQHELAVESALHQAEQEIFRLFNASASSSELSIRCFTARFSGGHMARICAPKFLEQTIRDNPEYFGHGYNVLTDHINFAHGHRQAMDQLQQQMAALVFNDDRFADALLDYDRLNQERRRLCRQQLASD